MKKILALTFAVTVIISILNIAVYATSDDEFTVQDLMSSRSYLIDKYCDGDITFSEYTTQSQAIYDKYYEHCNSLAPTSEASKKLISALDASVALDAKINSAVDKWGDSARDRISEWWNGVCNSNNVPTEDTHTSSTNMHGRGARIDSFEVKKNNKHYSVTLCDYIVIDIEKSLFINRTNDGSSSPFAYVGNDGKYSFSGNAVASSWGNLNSTDFSYKFYGDVRYPDGTPAPSDDEWIYTGTIKNFKDMSERDLEDLLNDFSEEIELQNPDLSSIEGLLNAIYARMGTLDSDNDNDLLASINANILALLEADNKKDEDEESTNEELIKTLLEIRDSLKNGTLGTAPSSHGHEISGTVYNVIPLDKNFLNKLFHDTENLKVEYEKNVYYLEDCGCLKLGDKYYTPNMNYDSYTFADYDFSNNNIDLDDTTYLGFKADNPLNLYNNLSFTQRRKIDNIVNAIYQMVTYSIPYAAITTAFAPFEVIIFNTAVPEDIVLNFNGTDDVGGFSATVLSVSFFQNQYVAAAMGIVKPFLTVVIGYCWLKVMRRKVVSM